MSAVLEKLEMQLFAYVQHKPALEAASVRITSSARHRVNASRYSSIH